MATKAASQSMVNDMDKYTKIAMADSIGKNSGRAWLKYSIRYGWYASWNDDGTTNG